MKTFTELFEKAKTLLSFHVQGTILEFTEEVFQRMNTLGVSKADLARKMEVKPAYITKMLGGTTNFTLESMVKVARALDSEIRIHLQPVGATTEWRDKWITTTQTRVKERIQGCHNREFPTAPNLAKFGFSNRKQLSPQNCRFNPAGNEDFSTSA